MTEQEIIENAPDGWTHHKTSANKYFQIEGCRMHVWLGEVWSVSISNSLDVLMDGDIRSRADIERIAELKSLCKECADHFDIYRYSDIVFDFTLREKIRKQVKE